MFGMANPDQTNTNHLLKKILDNLNELGYNLETVEMYASGQSSQVETWWQSAQAREVMRRP